MDKKEILVSCPYCKKRFSYFDSGFRPFCSERCQQVDLGHWLTESYKMAGPLALNEDEFEDETVSQSEVCDEE